MGLHKLPPDSLLSGDVVHGAARPSGRFDVFGVGQPEKNLSDAFLRQACHQTWRGKILLELNLDMTRYVNGSVAIDIRESLVNFALYLRTTRIDCL